MGIAALLDMRGVGSGQRTVQPMLDTMGVDPRPDLACLPPGAGDVDRAPMAVAAGAPAAAVQGIPDACLEAGGKALPIIIAEGAQQRPFQAGGIHCSSGVIELLAKLRIHAADDVVLHSEPRV